MCVCLVGCPQLHAAAVSRSRTLFAFLKTVCVIHTRPAPQPSSGIVSSSMIDHLSVQGPSLAAWLQSAAFGGRYCDGLLFGALAGHPWELQQQGWDALTPPLPPQAAW